MTKPAATQTQMLPAVLVKTETAALRLSTPRRRAFVLTEARKTPTQQRFSEGLTGQTARSTAGVGPPATHPQEVR